MSEIGKVFVVDDDASMREAVEHLLDAAGFECRAFASAEALLLESGAHAKADCIVSDLRLPALSGFELLSQLRGRGDSTPFVLITAHDAPGLREEARERGAAAYFTKPFLGTTLLTAVRKAIAA